ncbi:MAG: XTP/dITP diphosphatase [Deltaproteobacteria bacterium]|nr:XTP/dITP diphosphatase [Deltaproteobacteria bacterium]
MSDRILVLATRNKGKITELRRQLSGFDITIKGLDDFPPVPEAIEDGMTFEENAYKKAFSTARSLGLPALADDSGIVVRALGGEPGVHSARYAGDHASDEDRYSKLLKEMEGKTDRGAYFECAILIALPTGSSMTFTGRCDGEITFEPKGDKGFGYDPVFLYPPLNMTFAQIHLEEKNRVSHRGMAMARLKERFNEVLRWLEEQRINSHAT